MTVAVLEIGPGKNSCSLVGLDATGHAVLRRRIRRETVIAFGAKLQECGVAMEACCGTHHMGRAVAEQGYVVRLMTPECVCPYLKAQQRNNDRDAEAIAEAATCPTMRFLELKSKAQLDVQTMHRARDKLFGERTALINQICSILLKRGHVVPLGPVKWDACLAELLDTEAGSALTPRMHMLVTEVRKRWQFLGPRIVALDAEFAEQSSTDRDVRRLAGIPDIGTLNDTAVTAAIGDVTTSARASDRAAWLGLVARQVTTGRNPRLIGITERGSKYLRKTPIQGPHATMPTLRQRRTQLGQCLRVLLARTHANTAVVALAAKMTRIVRGASAPRANLSGHCHGSLLRA